MLSSGGKNTEWEAFKKGSKAAFEGIYREHAALLLDYGIRICNDTSVVEDCIQDLFIELWKSRRSLSSTTSIRYYLFKALRYKLYKTMSAERRDVASQPVEQYIYQFRNASYEEVYIEMEVQSEQMKHLRETLEKLPERQREAIILRYFHNFSNEEIANIMGVTYNSACKFIYAGLGNLKENLKMSVWSLSILIMFTSLFLAVKNIF